MPIDPAHVHRFEREPPMPEILSAGGVASGWFVLVRPGGDKGPWHRRPLLGLALVRDDAVAASYVVPLEAEGDSVGLARVGMLVHDSEFAACRCATPDLAERDAGFCRFCAGLVAS